MSCEEALRRLAEYLDRELDRRSDAALARHLERCRACFSRAEFERKLKQALRGTGSRHAPERLRSRIKSLVDSF